MRKILIKSLKNMKKNIKSCSFYYKNLKIKKNKAKISF